MKIDDIVDKDLSFKTVLFIALLYAYTKDLGINKINKLVKKINKLIMEGDLENEKEN